MKSFRLDRDSVDEFLSSWPVLLIAVALSIWLAWLGWGHWVWRGTAVVVAGAYLGYVFRGRLAESVREKYPHAKAPLLLSIGLVTLTLGVLVRMTFPAVQTGPLDLTWLAVAFCCILAFVVINRGDPDVRE